MAGKQPQSLTAKGTLQPTNSLASGELSGYDCTDAFSRNKKAGGTKEYPGIQIKRKKRLMRVIELKKEYNGKTSLRRGLVV